MKHGQWQRIQEIFFEALEVPEDERGACVQQRCAGDRAMERSVLAMLEYDGEEDPIIDYGLPAIALDFLEASRPQFESMHFGPYRLLDVLGEGGMGVVYLAEHTRNGHLVAIKVLLDARLSPVRRERFAGEQRILATLDHKNIARLYHADVLADGTPWFAMEYVGQRSGQGGTPGPGLPLLTYCQQRAASINERLRIFRDICEAVQYVHSKMVVHRDLKPSNILVTAAGEPKLIDFGIGKEIRHESSRHDRTLPGLRLMTVAYAAPEQLRGAEALPSTDVYALGVILYELIAGTHPFDLSSRTTCEAEREVLDKSPKRPSEAARANNRASLASPSQWKDLDALVSKAMHQDLERRYASAESLLQDIDNFLGARPLRARPDGFLYVATKFTRRNFRMLGSAAGVVVLLGALIGYQTIGLKRARDAAVREAARADRVQDFMLEMLRNGEQEIGPAQEMKVSDLVERGVREAKAMDRNPEIQADLFDTFGTIYQSWGKFDKAYLLLEGARKSRAALHGEDSVKAAESLLHLALWQNDQDHLQEAELMIRRVLEVQRHYLAADDQQIGRTWCALGRVQQRLGKYQESIDDLRQAISIQSKKGASLVDLSASIGLLANADYYLGNYAVAEALNRKGLALDQQIHGDNHPDISEDLINLGNIELAREQFSAAERDLRHALSIVQTWYGKDGRNLADAEIYLAKALVAENKLDEAQSLLRNAVGILLRQESDEPKRQMAMAQNELGKIAQRQGMWKQAAGDFAQAADTFAAVYGKEHPFTLNALGNLATVMLEEKEYSQAEERFRTLLKEYLEAARADPMQVGIMHIRLGRTLRMEQKYSEAEAEIEQGIQIIAAQGESNSSWMRDAHSDLLLIHTALNKTESAARSRIESAKRGSAK